MEDLLSQIGGPLIMVIVPALIFLVKQYLPIIPKMWLPVLAGFIGPGVDLMLTQVASIDSVGWQAVAWGFAAVALREFKEQVLKVMRGTHTPTTPAGSA